LSPPARDKSLIAQLPNSDANFFDILLFDTLPDDDVNPNWVFHLKRNRASLAVIYLLPESSSEVVITKALRSGADGYLFHTASREVLTRAVHTISDGGGFIQSDITPIVLDELRKPRFTIKPSDVQVDLTERERMLLQLAADGLANSQISGVFHVHEKTVRNMWSVLFHKLGMNDRTQAVLWAVRNGYAELR
jgi:two-component system, NarL family, response regulator DegU